jgi:hypothetical protein
MTIPECLGLPSRAVARLRRRAKQARQRREAELASARADERERQRKHRAQKREQSGAGPPLSRAGLPAQVVGLVEEILEELGQAQRLSQAGLSRQARRKMLRVLAKSFTAGADLGQDRPLSRTAHDRQVPMVVGETP